MDLSSETFVQNHALLWEKNPKLAFILSKTPYSSPNLPRLACKKLNENVSYIWGLFSLEESVFSSSSKVVIAVEKIEELYSFLSTKWAKNLLLNPNVFIDYLDDSFYETWSEKFPEEKISVISADEKQKEKEAFKIFSYRMQKNSTFSALLQLDRLYAIHPFKNFWNNLERMSHSIYANLLKDELKGLPMIICGAGPSLEEAYPALKALNNEAVIVSVGSSIAALSHENISPHLGMFLDPNFEEWQRMEKSTMFSMPFFYTPRLFHDCFATSSAPLGYMRTSMGQLIYSWLEEFAGLKEERIGEFLTKDALSVTTLAAATADYLGCDPIVFVGVDLAYTKEKRYAPGIVENGNEAFEENVFYEDSVEGKKLLTHIKWKMEKEALEHLAKKTDKTFINASKGLDLAFMEKMPLEKALKAKGNISVDQHIHAVWHSAKAALEKKQLNAFQKEVKKSLAACQNCLKVLAEPNSLAHKALAEIELKEEKAYQYLFYDTKTVLEKAYPEETEEKIWQRFFSYVHQYVEFVA